MRWSLWLALLLGSTLPLSACQSPDAEHRRCLREAEDALRVANPEVAITAEVREQTEHMCRSLKTAIDD